MPTEDKIASTSKVNTTEHSENTLHSAENSKDGTVLKTSINSFKTGAKGSDTIILSLNENGALNSDGTAFKTIVAAKRDGKPTSVSYYDGKTPHAPLQSEKVGKAITSAMDRAYKDGEVSPKEVEALQNLLNSFAKAEKDGSISVSDENAIVKAASKVAPKGRGI